MNYSPNSIKRIKQLIASWLLALFLLSNFGVNFVHHHEEHTAYLGKGKTDNKDCLVCYFQGLLYEPLTQKEFNTDRKIIERKEFIPSYSVWFHYSEFHISFQQRGPPFAFVA